MLNYQLKLLEKTPKHAKEIIIEANISPTLRKSKKFHKRKYTHPQFLTVYQGYDFLENLVLVRKFIQKKYKIDIGTLETLLFLFPKNYFTHQDYFEMPKPKIFNRIKYLIDMDMICITVNGGSMKKSVFRLTTKARNVVINFYQYLSGEEKIPEGPYKTNPFYSEKPNTMGRMRMNLVSKLNKLEPSEEKKSLFT
jgi:hypothetical protein